MLEPDISWWERNDCSFVGDVKYKKVNVAGIKHPDIYQLLSYTIGADVPQGLLIYAAGESEPRTHDILLAGKKLTVVSLDLAGGPDQILRQIDSLSQEIRQQRLGIRRENNGEQNRDDPHP